MGLIWALGLGLIWALFGPYWGPNWTRFKFLVGLITFRQPHGCAWLVKAEAGTQSNNDKKKGATCVSPWRSCKTFKTCSISAQLIPVSAKKTPIQNKQMHVTVSPRTPKFNVEASWLAGRAREMGVFFAGRKTHTRTHTRAQAHAHTHIHTHTHTHTHTCGAVCAHAKQQNKMQSFEIGNLARPCPGRACIVGTKPSKMPISEDRGRGSPTRAQT